MEFNESNASFSFDDTIVVCRLIDGKYPNYEAVIPKENPNKLSVSRETFLGSIRRVAIFANKTTHQVRLNIQGNELSISAEDLDFANEANERLTCSYDGEDMEIGFNARFLMEMLQNLTTTGCYFGDERAEQSGYSSSSRETRRGRGHIDVGDARYVEQLIGTALA